MDSVKLQTFPKPERGVCGARVSGSLNNRPQPCDIHSRKIEDNFSTKFSRLNCLSGVPPSSLLPTCCQSQNNHNFPSRRGRNGGGRGEGESGIPCTREGPQKTGWDSAARLICIHRARPVMRISGTFFVHRFTHTSVCVRVCARARTPQRASRSSWLNASNKILR